MLKTKIRKTWSLIKEGRFDKLLDTIAWSVPQWLFFYNHSILVFSDDPSWSGNPGPDQIVRFVTAGDCELLEPTGLGRESILARLKAGDKGVMALKDGEVMAVTWGATDSMYIRLCGISFNPGPDGAFYYGSYTNDRARKQGYFSFARQFIYRYFCSKGRPKNWGIINANNPEWLAVVLRKNYKIAGEVIFLKLPLLGLRYLKSWPYAARKFRVFFRDPNPGLKPV